MSSKDNLLDEICASRLSKQQGRSRLAFAADCDTVCAIFKSCCRQRNSPLLALALWIPRAGWVFFLHQQLPEAGTDRDQPRLQLRTDRLVYELYALIGEKTAMVEGKDL